MFKSFINILTILFIFIAPSIAETFKNIEIKGNKRISDKSVLMFSDVPESKIVDENSLNTILKNL